MLDNSCCILRLSGIMAFKFEKKKPTKKTRFDFCSYSVVGDIIEVCLQKKTDDLLLELYVEMSLTDTCMLWLVCDPVFISFKARQSVCVGSADVRSAPFADYSVLGFVSDCLLDTISVLK